MEGSQLSRCGEAGFATIGKALLLALAVTGAGLLAAAKMNGAAPAVAPGVVNSFTQVPFSDPHAELRVWLSEPPPPTF